MNKLFEEHYDELISLLNHIKVGVFITDGEGNVVLVNDESCRTGGLTRNEIVGRNVMELEKEGFIKESVTLKALENNKTVAMIQELGDGNEVFVVSQPVFSDGKIQFVITTEKDITEGKILISLLSKKANNKNSKNELEYLQKINVEPDNEVIAVDPISKNMISQITKIAKLDVPVLLTGESGVGKEIYANLVYENSERKGKPFIKVNCAAIPEHLFESEMFGYEAGAFTGAEKRGRIGYFEMADKGTIFLDEIAEVPMHLQSKLLRVLQEGEIRRLGGTKILNIDTRIIAATNVDLSKAIEEQRFREDLFYRLNIMPVEILPLRQRKNDIKALASYFVAEFNKKYNTDKYLTNTALEMIYEYNWPGNVRQLKNFMERCVICYEGTEINEFQIQRLLYPNVDNIQIKRQQYGYMDGTLLDQVEAYEANKIKEALQSSKNATQAATKLGMTKSTLSRRMKKYGIKNE